MPNKTQRERTIIRTKSNEGLSINTNITCTYSTYCISNIMNYWENQTAYSCLFSQTEHCGRYTSKDFTNNPKRIPDRDNNMHKYYLV